MYTYNYASAYNVTVESANAAQLRLYNHGYISGITIKKGNLQIFGQGFAENVHIYDKAQIAEDVKGELDDNSSSYEDQTQLNLMKRLALGFLKFLQNGSGDQYVREYLGAEFADLANDSGIVPWGDLVDAIQYDDKAEEEE